LAAQYQKKNRVLHVVLLLLAVAGVEARAQPVDSAQPPAQENSREGEPATDAAPAERFNVWEYRVLGSQVLPQQTVERTLYSHLGPRKTIMDVEAARQALETAYRTAGYSTVFVDIPEQTVDSGVVRLKVTEGKLDRLRVTGARYFSNRQILASVPSLAAGEVPHFPAVQQQLAELNRVTPDRSVTPVLRAGRYPGTVDVELKVADKLPFHASVEASDRYTADTTELRSSVNLSYGNLWQRAHTASLQYQWAPQNRDEAKVIAGTYVARLDRAKTLLALYAVDSNSEVAAVGTLSVLGAGKIYGVRAIRTLDGIGRYFQNLTLGIDFKNFDENIRLTQQDGLATAIRYTNWSANYGFGWMFPKWSTELSAGAAWGIRGFGNDDAEFEQKRFKARANYLYLNGSAQVTRKLFEDTRFVTRLNWQYSPTPLISNEQFTAGGATSVRGYLEVERLGDTGATLSFEFQSPSLAKGPRVDDLRLLAFVDGASLSIREPLPSQQERFDLASAGFGLRFRGLSGMSAELDWARVLRDGANVQEGDDRVHFRLNYGF
jgi:hemolysin activation/secretion protein